MRQLLFLLTRFISKLFTMYTWLTLWARRQIRVHVLTFGRALLHDGGFEVVSKMVYLSPIRFVH